MSPCGVRRITWGTEKYTTPASNSYIIIHSEESDMSCQHFYPPSALSTYTSTLPTKNSSTIILRHVPPSCTLKKKFIFPLFIETGSKLDVDGKLESNLSIRLFSPPPCPFPLGRLQASLQDSECVWIGHIYV